MRLIDADKLIVEVVHSGNIVCLPHFSLEQIDTAPVVEAIPIKDIKDFLRCEKIDRCDWLNCSECSQIKCISIRNLNDLIEWSKEKESEANAER